MTTKFSELLKNTRIEQTGKSLREFCAEAGIDAGNYSKLERGLINPPSREYLEKYAHALKLVPNSDEWLNFFDLAAAAKGHIPADILDDAELMGQLPAMFRTLRQKRLSDESLDELVDLVRKR